MSPADITNRKLLAGFLGVSDAALRKYLTQTPIVVDRATRKTNPALYGKSWIIKHSIPKRNRGLGFRIVYEVRLATLGGIHKCIYAQLLKSYKPSPAVHGFVAGRGIYTNAKEHLGKKTILCFDIKNFFESIIARQVGDVFASCGFSAKVSTDLAKLCTLNGHLAQGYVMSPIIANMVAAPLDEDLSLLVSGVGAEYTRYADDITISSNSELPRIAQLEKIIERYGFQINPSKTRSMFRGEKQYVTGLTVFDKTQPRIPRRYKRKIRLLLYYMGKYGKLSFQLEKLGYKRKDYETDLELRADIDSKMLWEDRKLKGWIDFVNSIEPARAAIYYGQYNALKK